MKLAMNGIGKELTRDELKNVFGGSNPKGSGSGPNVKDQSKCNNYCNSDADCGGSKSYCPHCNTVVNWDHKVCQSSPQ